MTQFPLMNAIHSLCDAEHAAASLVESAQLYGIFRKTPEGLDIIDGPFHSPDEAKQAASSYADDQSVYVDVWSAADSADIGDDGDDGEGAPASLNPDQAEAILAHLSQLEFESGNDFTPESFADAVGEFLENDPSSPYPGDISAIVQQLWAAYHEGDR